MSYECDYCGNGISADDEYIKDGDSRYCDECYEEYDITIYNVGGEHLGTDDEIVKYYSGESEDG